jgi:hypothetical protein
MYTGAGEKLFFKKDGIDGDVSNRAVQELKQ